MKQNKQTNKRHTCTLGHALTARRGQLRFAATADETALRTGGLSAAYNSLAGAPNEQRTNPLQKRATLLLTTLPAWWRYWRAPFLTRVCVRVCVRKSRFFFQPGPTQPRAPPTWPSARHPPHLATRRGLRRRWRNLAPFPFFFVFFFLSLSLSLSSFSSFCLFTIFLRLSSPPRGPRPSSLTRGLGVEISGCVVERRNEKEKKKKKKPQGRVQEAAAKTGGG